MASESSDHVVANDTESLFLETKGWTHIHAVLESSADGVNEFAYGGSFARIEPGVSISHIVAPDTKIRIKSTSVEGARWAILVTDLTFIDTIIAALCALGGGR